jgi:hypothetical protein
MKKVSTGPEEGKQGGRPSRLIRDGVLRPRQTGTPEALLNASPPPVKASTVELLINERREGR